MQPRFGNYFFYFLAILPFLPVFTAVGTFSESDSTIFAFWFVAGLLAIYISINPKEFKNLPIFSYGFFLLSLLGVVGVLQNGLKSIGGINEIREGAATFFAVATYLAFSKKINLQPALLWLFPLIYAGITILGHYGWLHLDWKTYQFLDIASFAMLASVPMYSQFRKRLAGPQAFDSLYVCCFSLLLFYCDNDAATLACLCAFIFVFILPIVKAHYKFLPKNDGFYVVVGLLLIAVIVLLSWFFLSSIPPQLQSRTMLGIVTILHYFDNFTFSKLLNLFFGSGLGSFQEFPVLNLFRLENVGMYETGSFNPTWEYINRNLVHSHNIILEVLLSTGIVGAGLFLTLVYKGVNNIEKADLAARFYIVSYLILLSAWFQTPTVLVFAVLALFFIEHKSGKHSLPRSVSVVGGVFLLIFSSLELWSSVALKKHKFNSIESFESDIDKFINDPAHLYDKFSTYKLSNRIISQFSFEMSKLSENDARYLSSLERAVIKISNDYLNSRQKNNVLSSIAVINLVSNFMSLSNGAIRADSEIFHVSKKLIQEHLSRFPERADMSIGFFVFCFDIIRNSKEVDEMADFVLASSPNHPVGLWFKGIAGLSLGIQKQQSLEKMKAAIRLGLDRFMPIDKSILISLGISR